MELNNLLEQLPVEDSRDAVIAEAGVCSSLFSRVCCNG